MKLKTEIERELHGAKRTLKRKNVTFLERSGRPIFILKVF